MACAHARSQIMLFAVVVLTCTAIEAAGSVQCAPVAQICPLPTRKRALQAVLGPSQRSLPSSEIPQRVMPASNQRPPSRRLQERVALHLQAQLQQPPAHQHRGQQHKQQLQEHEQQQQQQQEQQQQQAQPQRQERPKTPDHRVLLEGTTFKPGNEATMGNWTETLWAILDWAGSELQKGPAGASAGTPLSKPALSLPLKPKPPASPKPRPTSPPKPQLAKPCRPSQLPSPVPMGPLPPSWDPNLVYLRSGSLTVGVDCQEGGTIAHLSSSAVPAPWTNVNMVNTFDTGRVIQQSYYGCSDGSCWGDQPWSWNPVQGGSWQNWPSRVLQCGQQGQQIASKVLPRNWAGQQTMYDVVMENNVTMVAGSSSRLDAVKVHFSMHYSGDCHHPNRIQEVPAVFVDRRLGVLAVYTGNKPWTNANMSWLLPHGTNMNMFATENWAAYVDAKSGYGLGVYVPTASALTAYRIGQDGSTSSVDVSYFALTTRFAVEPGMVFEYEAWLAVGRVDQMRATFDSIRKSNR